jgi:outer membrane receptor protein involved in Fe transport
MKTNITKGLLLTSSAAALGIFCTTAATAQEAPAGRTSSNDEIVVTGTRITIPNYTSPSPVVAITADTIQKSGDTNITTYLTRLPALVGSGTRGKLAGASADAFIGSTGLNLLDLRNLGVERTLVLINGRRHVAALPGTAAVDINTIPVDLIERVDVLTGGESAIYGADGVTGVVNFIMKRDFEGIKASARYGLSEKGGADELNLSITAGKNFSEGRGNFTLSYQYAKEGRLEACDRKYLCGSNYVNMARNPADAGDDPTIPDYIPQRRLSFFDSSRGGALDLDFDGMPELNADGSAFNNGTFVPPYYHQDGSGTRTADYVGNLIPSTKRHIVNALFSYEFSPAARLFAEAKYVNVKSYATNQPTFDFYNYLSVDNPFMPDTVRAQVTPGGAAAAFEMDLPDGVLINRDNFDLGVRGESIKRETIRTVVGLDGEINSHLKYEVSYTYGQTKVANRMIGNQYNDRFYNAIDVVKDGNGNPACRITLEGASYQPYPSWNYSRSPTGALTFSPNECVPLNIFGDGSPSQAAIDWIRVNTVDHSKLTQQVFNANLSGDFGQLFELPAGPVRFSLGGEYRKEKSSSRPDDLVTAGLTYTNQLMPENGKYDVWEVYGELYIPLIKDKPWAKELSVGGALRFSDYSTIGKTTTWKVNGLWAVNDGLSFRGTYSQAVRAPNIGELFAPSGQDFQRIDDPCATLNVGNGSSSRQANCLALLSGLGVSNPGNFIDPNSATISGFTGGNQSLTEETAKTWTAGIAVQPVPRLRVALDWYNISLRNAISTPSTQDLAELCVDQPTLDNQFCNAITREQGTGKIVSFSRMPQNVAAWKTAGLDLTLNYNIPTESMGTFDLQFVGGYLHKLQTIAMPGAEIENERGQPYKPKFLANLDLTWRKGPFTMNYGLAWFSKTYRYDFNEMAANPDIAEPKYKKYKERARHDIYASYDFEDRFKLFGGVRNFTNQKPDVGSIAYPIDAVGRFFFMGVEAKFGNLF